MLRSTNMGKNGGLCRLMYLPKVTQDGQWKSRDLNLRCPSSETNASYHSFSLETLVVLHGKGRVGPVSSVAFFYECDDVV